MDHIPFFSHILSFLPSLLPKWVFRSDTVLSKATLYPCSHHLRTKRGGREGGGGCEGENKKEVIWFFNIVINFFNHHIHILNLSFYLYFIYRYTQTLPQSNVHLHYPTLCIHIFYTTYLWVWVALLLHYDSSERYETQAPE